MFQEAPRGGESHGETAPEITNGLRGFEAVGVFLEEDGWHPQRLEDRTIYRVYFSGNNGDLRCYAQVRMDLEQFLFYVIAPVKAPEPQRAVVAEYLTRANYGLRIGNFEMDYNDGEVRYKSGLDFEGTVLNSALIKNTIYPAVHTMDFYLPGLLSVMYGNQGPADAIDEIKN